MRNLGPYYRLICVAFSIGLLPAQTAVRRTGDWIVQGSETISNTSIVMAGNLIIPSGATLTLTDVELRFDRNPASVYRLQASAGSHLFISDSNLAASQPDIRYAFVAD